MAEWPYNTSRWKRLRLAKLADKPLCEECRAIGILTPANTVDHITPVNHGGDPFPTLDGLRSLCPSCHGAKTARGIEAGAVRSSRPRKGCATDGRPFDPAHPWNGGTGVLPAWKEERRLPRGLKPSRIPLTIVTGAPGSGKSTYVREHARPHDVVICLDTIMQQQSGLPEHQTSIVHLPRALRERNRLLRRLAIDKAHRRAWFITAAPNPRERKQWAQMLGGELVVMRTSLEECARRIRADASRQGHEERMIDAAARWWAANPHLQPSRWGKSLGTAPRKTGVQPSQSISFNGLV